AVDVGARIGAVLKRWHAPVFVLASNDMTHFAPAERAREQDQKAIARMEALDAAGLLATARRERITMCGAQPVAAMLAATGVLGARRGELVGYANSAAISGDESDVVAYAGVVVE
ncbi:MAG TPA: AmmeMemoRadiSam system protein B, partial [Planctomycetota bacterium]|nr:AmmeMemoRadiSam system protein B [Planctomycetota bacterium]